MDELFLQFLFQIKQKNNVQRFLKLNKFGNKFYYFILEKLSEKIVSTKNNQISKQTKLSELPQMDQILILNLLQKENFPQKQTKALIEEYSQEIPKNSFCYYLLNSFKKVEIQFSDEVLNACHENQSFEFKQKPKRKIEELSKEEILTKEKRRKTSNFDEKMNLQNPAYQQIQSDEEMKDSVDLSSEEALITEELLSSLTEIKEIISSFKNSTQIQFPKKFQIFKSLTNFQLEYFFKELKMSNFTDEMILSFTKFFVDSETTYQNCCSFVSLVFFEKISTSKKIISRILFTSLTIIIKFNEKSVIDFLLKPLLKNENYLQKNQLELSTKLIEKLSKNNVFLLLQFFFEKSENVIWNDQSLILLRNLMNLKFEINDQLMMNILMTLESKTNKFQKSSKFGLLLFTLISKYESTILIHFDLLNQILDKLDISIKKSMTYLPDAILLDIYKYPIKNECLCQALTAAQQKSIVDAHNKYRKLVNPPAKSMPDLTWDADLAKVSEDYIKKCVSSDGKIIDHNSGRSNTYPGYVGENIYASTGSISNFETPVLSWFNEYKDYTYSTNKCASGKVCGHYTQVVWAKTTKVGCAYYTCNSVTFKNTILCNYSPGGNFNGESPYEQGSNANQFTISIVTLIVSLTINLLF
eukprot:gene261-6676_t